MIKVGDLPRPEPGPGQVLVRVHAVALNPIDLYIRSGLVAMPLAFPYVIGCDLAGTVEQLGPGCTRFKVGDRVWGSNQGLLGRQGVAAEFAAVDEDWLYPTPALLPDDRGRGDGPGRDHGPPGAVPVRPAQVGRDRSMSRAAAAASARWSSRWPRRPGARVATSAGSPERARALPQPRRRPRPQLQDRRHPGRLREFAPEGVDVWYETQREPNLEVSIPLLRKHGRMILMAGRTAKPALPLGAFYPAELRDLRLRHVQRHAGRATAPCADDIIRWIEEGQLKPIVGRTFPLAAAVEAETFLEDNTLKGGHGHR